MILLLWTEPAGGTLFPRHWRAADVHARRTQVAMAEVGFNAGNARIPENRAYRQLRSGFHASSRRISTGSVGAAPLLFWAFEI